MNLLSVQILLSLLDLWSKIGDFCPAQVQQGPQEVKMQRALEFTNFVVPSKRGFALKGQAFLDASPLKAHPPLVHRLAPKCWSDQVWLFFL